MCWKIDNWLKLVFIMKGNAKLYKQLFTIWHGPFANNPFVFNKLPLVWHSYKQVNTQCKPKSFLLKISYSKDHIRKYPGVATQIAEFMGTYGPPRSCRSQVGPMLVPWTLLSGDKDHRYPWLPWSFCGRGKRWLRTKGEQQDQTWPLLIYYKMQYNIIFKFTFIAHRFCTSRNLNYNKRLSWNCRKSHTPCCRRAPGHVYF